MKIFKYLLIVIMSALLGAALVLVFPPPSFKKAIGNVAEGDYYLKNGLPKTALDRYEQAQKQWPILHFDRGLQRQIENAEEERTKNAALTIYLNDNATESQVQSLIDEIKTIDGVREVKLVSKEETLELYKEKLKDETSITKYVTADLFPATILVYLDDLLVRDQISKLAESKTFVDEVIKSQDL